MGEDFGLGLVPIAITLVIGAISAALFWRSRRAGGSSPTPNYKVSFPEDGRFTFKSIEPFDGVTAPMCVGVCGKVVDVSSSENFKPGEGYGKLWAGRDATYALATLSLTDTDANNLDFKLEDFTEDQSKALAGWYKHFTTKYPIVGHMEEYRDWDFSSIEELAKSQTPFGAKKDKDSEGNEPFAKAAAPSTAPPTEEPRTIKKGDKVELRGCSDQPALNGKTGVLKGFSAEQKKFEVELAGGEETVYVTPAQLVTK